MTDLVIAVPEFRNSGISGVLSFPIRRPYSPLVQRCPALLAWRVAVSLGRDLGREAEAAERANGSRTVEGSRGGAIRCWSNRDHYHT